MFYSYRNKSVNLQVKSITSFLYDPNIGLKWVKQNGAKMVAIFSAQNQHSLINSCTKIFSSSFLTLHPLKTPKKLWFSDVFKGIKWEH